MASVQGQPERRRFSRIAFHRPGELRAGAARVGCGVQDVSLKGARVEVPAAFPGAAGEPCALVIQLDQGDTLIRMDGVIAHRDGEDVGIRCTGIDLDSIAHLRRLVEVNLGDEALLYRELAALVGGDD
ncbi:type IV pilus assembly PilZ [Anaeromyxobacter sp. K]|uniref:PilZ domain-containing protein n=1 Tax=Anaeromyxobacter sp. (strain K) TaxID=447217 RepID=UPI00015F88A7|nr:PilZ domain-containing protein [Anaeromyxobacter sp. K]ACG74300.1 type IV pilus assembly PilZ [Anaeromyxobacter sp. K]